MLEARLDAVVELPEMSVVPGLVTRVSGGPLTIRHRRHMDVAPLIRLERFETAIGWRQLLWAPRRVEEVRLMGLAVVIPPSPGEGQPRFGPRDSSPAADTADSADDGSPRDARPSSRPPAFVIGRVTADAATLVILPREARKLPRRFVMHTLTVHEISTTTPMTFDTVVDNPLPRGRIETRGTLGPWDVETPARTPLAARYRFVDADLSTIRGIGGTLQSEGVYGGVLERIEATGTSTTPDFSLDVGGRPQPLVTAFTVIVDGTNGNTYIQPAEATLGAHTPIRVTGGVVKAEDRRGRTVDLAMQIADGRLEEVLALVVDGTPAMRGRLRVVASLLIPPGPGKVVQRMILEGSFGLSGTTFASRLAQARIDELSRRAQGRPGDTDVTRQVSAFEGRFRMADGIIRFPRLSFRVDGARVDLAGRYVLDGQALDFEGRIRLDAGVSRMVTGKRAWLLRPFDPLFRRDGATEFPIHIRGTVERPDFGVDVKETLKRAILPGR